MKTIHIRKIKHGKPLADLLPEECDALPEPFQTVFDAIQVLWSCRLHENLEDQRDALLATVAEAMELLEEVTNTLVEE